MPYRYLPGTTCRSCGGTGKTLVDLIANGFSADAAKRWVVFDDPSGPKTAPVVLDLVGNYVGTEFRCLGCDGTGQDRVMEY